MTEGNKERGKTEIGVAASRTPRCAAEVATDKSRKSDFRMTSNQREYAESNSDEDRERESRCVFLRVMGGVLFHMVNTVRFGELPWPAVRTQVRIRLSGENGHAKYAALVKMVPPPPPISQQKYKGGKNYPVIPSESVRLAWNVTGGW